MSTMKETCENVSSPCRRLSSRTMHDGTVATRRGVSVRLISGIRSPGRLCGVTTVTNLLRWTSSCASWMGGRTILSPLQACHRHVHRLVAPVSTALAMSSAASIVGDKRDCSWNTLLQNHKRWWDDTQPKKHGSLVDAQSEICLTPEFVKNLCKQGQVKGAVEVLDFLAGTNYGIDKHLLCSVVKECSARKDLVLGGHIHALAVKMGFGSDTFLCNHFIRLYAGHGKLLEAMDVFRGVALPDAFTWSSIISAHVKQGQAQLAIQLYKHMRDTRVKPDGHVFVAALQACASSGDLQSGKKMHDDVLACGMENDRFICSCLIEMYLKCGCLKDARRVFDRLGEKNVVTWTVMIAAYAKAEGMGQDALTLYSAMHNEGMLIPDAVTFVCLLQACANVGVSALDKGKQLHSHIREQGLESDVAVGGSLVNMYAKCGSLKDARGVFDGLNEKNVVTWTAMIAGYAKVEGMGQEALNIYTTMRSKGMAIPNAVTYVCLLEACLNVGALEQGKELHAEIRGKGMESNALIGSCLVRMYAKCGCLEVSREVFDRLPLKDLVTWNALLKEYAENGEGDMVIQFFEELLEQGVQPDEVTYTCLFTACSRAALVDVGLRYFETMEKRHGVKPDEWHYTCMVDLLGRSGQLDRAEQILQSSGLVGSVVSWTALLSACKTYGDADLGSRCFHHLVNLEPTSASAYVLLGGIYANAGRWDEVKRVEILRKAAGARKKAAKACIEVNKEVHEFTVGEERSDVAATLRKMNTTLKEGGHVPQTQLVLRAVSEQEKEDALCGHAEKLALAYGLLSTPAGSTLVVTKNLRMCNDCHSSTKIMSRVEKRDIVVRDAHKVHRFQNGVCSCQDRP